MVAAATWRISVPRPQPHLAVFLPGGDEAGGVVSCRFLESGEAGLQGGGGGHLWRCRWVPGVLCLRIRGSGELAFSWCGRCGGGNDWLLEFLSLDLVFVSVRFALFLPWRCWGLCSRVLAAGWLRCLFRSIGDRSGDGFGLLGPVLGIWMAVVVDLRGSGELEPRRRYGAFFSVGIVPGRCAGTRPWFPSGGAGPICGLQSHLAMQKEDFSHGSSYRWRAAGWMDAASLELGPVFSESFAVFGLQGLWSVSVFVCLRGACMCLGLVLCLRL